MLDAATLIRQTADERKKLVVLVEGLTETQASYRSAPDVWSVKENLEHLVIAEIYGVTKMWTAALGVRDGNPLWVGEHVNRGLSIDEVIARTWKPCETAPPGSTPRIGGPMLYWLESFRVSQLLLNRLEPAFDGLDLESVIIPRLSPFPSPFPIGNLLPSSSQLGNCRATFEIVRS